MVRRGDLAKCTAYRNQTKFINFGSIKLPKSYIKIAIELSTIKLAKITGSSTDDPKARFSTSKAFSSC